MTKSPAAVTYAIVVSLETVRISLTIAALNDLQVKCGDVLKAYITAPVMELIWTTLGPKFGYDQGKTEMDVRAALLYVNTLGNVCLVLVTNHVLLILNFGLSRK